MKTKRVEIVYYTGTGCTAYAAECLFKAFADAGCTAGIHRIMAMELVLPEHDLLVLLFPVHAFNAPEAVYKWIESLPAVDRKSAVVISISGGGEICPNTAARVSSIKRLEKKGYDVVFEESIVMPSNIIVATNDLLAVKLLEVLPDKLQKITCALLSDKKHRLRPLLIDRFFSAVGEVEKPAAKSFGKSLDITDECNGCGWCAGNCPAGNITQAQHNKPVFGKKCHFCLCCIYGCPKNAIVPRKYKFIAIKEGFDLDRLKKMIPLQEPVDIDKLAKGFLWSGVGKYLNTVLNYD